MGTKVDAPPARDYGKETRDTLQAQVDLMPDIFEAESEFRPQFAELDMGIAEEMMPRLGEMYKTAQGYISEADMASMTSQREADVASIEQLGGRAREAFLDANPLQAELERQAMLELEAGGTLTDYDSRRVQQGIRGAQAARGMGHGVNDAAMEAYVQDRAFEDRKAQRRAFASNVAAGSADPFMQILGRQSRVTPASYMGATGQAGSYNPGQLFNPESQYAGDLYQSNQQSQLAANTASASNNSALFGGLLGAAGMFGGGYLAGRK